MYLKPGFTMIGVNRVVYLLLIICICKKSNALVQSPPRIVKQPPTDELLFQVAEQNNGNDKPFIIECEAEGEPSPQFKWIKNGKHFDWQAYDGRIVQQPGRGTLVISEPRDEDLGQYQCFAYNDWGVATSNSVFVRKAELNSFKDASPISVTVNEGAPFRLTCDPPDGWPKPNVCWLIQYMDGGIKSINNSRMTVDPEGNLWFSNVTRNDASDDFNYVCAATSVFRNEYKLGNKFVLNVIANDISASHNRYAPVKQYVSRKNEVALRGKKLELYCIYGGTPLPQIVWSKNGKVVHSSDRITQGNYGKSLIIKYVTFDDEGRYTCEASNGVGIAGSYSINLHVIAAPYFTVEPQIKNAAANETVEFKCEAYGVPEPQIMWIHNGKPISEAPPNPRRKVSTNSVVIEKLTKTDTGNYGCNATNSIGYVYKDVFLNVQAVAPEITEPPHDVDTVDHETITMMCRVFGVPKPQVKWERNGEELTGGRYEVLNNGDLQIQNVQFSDAGEYTCYASNKFGDVDASAFLYIKRVPNAPELQGVSCNKYDATIRWRPMGDNGEPILHYTVFYNTSFKPYTWEVAHDSVPAYDMTYSVPLKPWTNYTFRVVAWNKNGKSPASEHSDVCITPPDVPHKNPEHIEAKGTEPNNLVIRWNAMPQIEHGGPKFLYRVFFKRDIPSEQYSVVDISDWKTTEYIVNDQPSFQQYRIKVVATNELGEADVAPKEIIGYSGE